MQNLPAIVAEWVVVLFIAGLAVIVLIKIWSNAIDLAGLLSEPADPTIIVSPGTVPPQPKASLSRLQLLLFTVVIVGLYLTLSLEAGAMVEIPNQVLGLLGISGGSYVISKGIQANK
jgi:hypothetical protein